MHSFKKIWNTSSQGTLTLKALTRRILWVAFCFAKNRLFRVLLSLHSFATLRNWLRQPLQSLPLFKIKKLEIEPNNKSCSSFVYCLLFSVESVMSIFSVLDSFLLSLWIKSFSCESSFFSICSSCFDDSSSCLQCISPFTIS